MSKTIIIIGSGIGGLASAIRLAAKGHQVSLFEKNPLPGGKLSEIRYDGFRFDTGPSLFTMPWLVDELFTLCGEKPEDHFKYHRTRSTCKYFWEDGMVLNAWNEKEKFTDQAALTTGEARKNIEKALERSRELYDMAGEAFLFNNIHKPETLAKKEFRNILKKIHRLDAFTSMHKRNKSYFSSKNLVQLFDRYATYNGSSPYRLPATFNIIPHLEHNTGAFFPEKGMYSIVEALTNLAVRKGVNMELNTRVKEVIAENRKIKGIKTDKGFHPCDILISNTDVVNFYKQLLPVYRVPHRQLKLQRSSSALIFFWAVNRTFPQLELHNILFSKNYREEFHQLFNTLTISNDPTVYIFLSSKNVKADAPKDHENWYVMINAPENKGQDWNALVEKARRDIIRKINRLLKSDIEKNIIWEMHHDPRSIEAYTGSYNGSLYGISSHGMLAAFNRHPNFSRKINNLYFTGGSVHPGGGIPLCLASAKIVDNEIEPPGHNP